MVWPFSRKKELSPEELEKQEKERVFRQRVAEDTKRQPRSALVGERGSDPIFHRNAIKALQTPHMDTSKLIVAFEQAIKDLRAVEVQMRFGVAEKPTLVGPLVSNYIQKARLLDRDYYFGQIYERMSAICNSLNSGLDGISFVTKQGIFSQVQKEYQAWLDTGSRFLRIQDAYLDQAMKVVSDAWKEDSNLQRFSPLHVFQDAMIKLQNDKTNYIKYKNARHILNSLNRALVVGLKKDEEWIRVTQNPDLWKKYVQRIHEMIVRKPNPRLRLGFQINNAFVQVHEAYKQYYAAYHAYKKACEEVNEDYNKYVELGLESLLKGSESGKHGNIVWFQQWLARDHLALVQKATSQGKQTGDFEQAYVAFNNKLDDLHLQITTVTVETKKLKKDQSDEVAQKLLGIKFAA